MEPTLGSIELEPHWWKKASALTTDVWLHAPSLLSQNTKVREVLSSWTGRKERKRQRVY